MDKWFQATTRECFDENKEFVKKYFLFSVNFHKIFLQIFCGFKRVWICHDDFGF